MRHFLWILLAAIFAARAHAGELIPPGSHAKISAGAGQTTSRGAASLFHNPANLIFSKFVEPQLDIAFANVTYQYQHFNAEKYEPAVVKVSAPPITAGLTLRFIPSLSLGAAVVPTGTGAEQAVTGVPLAVTKGADPQVMNIINKNSGMKIAAGAAYRLAYEFTLGFGLIRTSERTQLLLFPVTDGEQAEDPFIDALYGGAFNQFVVGARSELFDRSVALAGSFRTAVVKKYAGDVLLNLNEDSDYEPIDAAGYAPAVIGVGAEVRFGSFGGFVDFVMEQWGAARTVFKRGIGPDKDSYDFINTNQIGAGVKFWPAPKHMLEAAFSIVGPNMGDGNVETAAPSTLQDEAADPTIGGPQFGSLEAIGRTTFAGGYRAKIQGNGYFQAGVHYTSGARVIPEGLEGEGQYSLTALIAGLGIAYGF